MDKSALLVVSCVAFAVFNNNQVAACCWCRRLTANFPTEEDNLNSTVGRRLQYINKNSLLKEKQKGQYAVHYRTCALTRTQCAGKPLSTCNFNCPGDLDLSQSGVTGAIPKSICSAKGLTGLRISSTDDLYAPSHQTGSSSTLLHRHPCQFKVPTPLTPLGSNACTPGHKCQACQGDCDKDSDCATGLKCFQRNDRTPVPGCRNGMSGDKPGWDYCYKKEEKVKRPTTNHISGGLPQCVGDLVNLETLDLSVGFHKPTGISGSIPKSICKLKKLTRLCVFVESDLMRTPLYL